MELIFKITINVIALITVVLALNKELMSRRPANKKVAGNPASDAPSETNARFSTNRDQRRGWHGLFLLCSSFFILAWVLFGPPADQPLTGRVGFYLAIAVINVFLSFEL